MKMKNRDFLTYKTDSDQKKKVLLTLWLGVLLFVLYLLIFFFSSQNADTSTNVSMSFTEGCVKLFSGIKGDESSAKTIQELVLKYNVFFRKLAHFSEYALMGMLVYGILAQWFVMDRNALLCNELWVLLSAAGDEAHQIFVPGRASSVWDVLLDGVGGLFGILLLLLFWRVGKRLHFFK